MTWQSEQVQELHTVVGFGNELYVPFSSEGCTYSGPE